MQDNIAKDIIKTKYFPKLPYLSQERSQKFISIVLTLLALSFFALFAISPTISTILKLRKEFSDSQFVYDQLDSKIKNLSALRIRYANLQNDLPVIIDAISTVPDVHLLFAQIQTVARESNVKLSKLQNFEVEVLRKNKGPGKQYYSYSFSAAGSGSLDNIYNFVSTIINMQRIINIEVFAINNTSSQDVASLGFNIQATSFFKE